MRRRERQMEAEFADHFEREAEANREVGMSTAEARRQAALAFGGRERWHEEGREAKGVAWLEALGRDLRLATRGLRRTPGFTAGVVLTLALGIGVNAAMFSVVQAVLLRPLPFPEPDRLVQIGNTDTRQPGGSLSSLSYPDFLDFRHTSGFSGMAAYSVDDFSLTGAGPAAHVSVGEVSASLLDVLGVAPAAGRGFRPGEDRPGSLAGADAAVLGDALAREKFGSAARAMGQRITLNARPFVVVGVMPPGFQFPLDRREDLWTTIAPLAAASPPPMTAQRSSHFLWAVARLAPGTALARAGAQLDVVAARLRQSYPKDDQDQGLAAQPMLDTYTAAARPELWMLLGAVGLVLLIACVNVAGLLLARAARRRPEFALRAALGASRGAVLRQLGCESLLLGLLGAGTGLILAQAAVLGFVRFGPADLVRLQQTRIDLGVLLFALGLGLVTALLFGLAPAREMLQAGRGAGLSPTLQGAGRGSDGEAGSHAWRRGLVAAQFGLAVVVLAGAMLLLHSLGRLARANPGFSAENVLCASIQVPDARYPTPDADHAFFAHLLDQLQRQPSIAVAALGLPAPLDGNTIGVGFDLTGHPVRPQPESRFAVITPGYFAALRIPLLAGRNFRAADSHLAPQVAIVNQAFARRFFPGANAIGQRITPGFSSYDGPVPPRVIVAVAASVRMDSLAAPDRPMIYIPEAQAPINALTLVARARPGAEAAAAAAVREAVRGLDADVPVYDLQPLAARERTSLAPVGFEAGLLSLFAGLGLLLAAVGLYAVMAQAVAQRRREIGIRMALGAEQGAVMGMLLREGVGMALIGVTAGWICAVALSRVLAAALGANLYATPALDPLAFVGAPLLLLGVAGLACALPARRAASADPVAALRL